MVKPPELYTVGSILQAVELSMSPVSCLDLGQAECSRKSFCRTLPLWQGLDRGINDYLEHVTLADLMYRETPGDDYVI